MDKLTQGQQAQESKSVRAKTTHALAEGQTRRETEAEQAPNSLPGTWEGHRPVEPVLEACEVLSLVD